MAVLRKGRKGFRGKLGNSVVYPLNGQWIKRGIGKNNKPPSIMQLACRQQTTICAELLSPVKDFIDIGFKGRAKIERKNAHNMATSYNRLNAVIGDYPNQQIDFTKALFSEGRMPLTRGIKAELTSQGVEFTWEFSENSKGINGNDQVMLLAYVPEENDAVFQLNGERRIDGKDMLKIPRYDRPVVLETYLTFISADRKIVSNSVYTGQFLWP